MNLELEHTKRVSAGTIVCRFAARGLTFLFQEELVRGSKDGLPRLEKLAEEGYGSIVVVNHFSTGDMPRVMAPLFASRVLGERELLFPIAAHQDKGVYKSVGKYVAVETSPIVTLDTLQFMRDKPLAGEKLKAKIEKDGGAQSLLDRYFDRSINVLKSGGVIVLAPQGARRPYLGRLTHAVSELLKKTDQANVNNIAIFFLGLSIPGEQDYSRNGIAGYNLFKKYELTTGITVAKQELKDRSKKENKPIDVIIHEELATVVSPSYLSKAA